MQGRLDKSPHLGATLQSRIVVALLGMSTALATWSGCDANQLPECAGALGLWQQHTEALACAGWLEFVKSNIGIVQYIPSPTFELGGSPAVGSSNCHLCTARIATKDRPEERILATIVHEAAHIEEGCIESEVAAERAEFNFLTDYRRFSCFEPGGN